MNDPAAPRLAGITPATMTADQRRVYDAILDGPRDRPGRTDAQGALRGPFNTMLLSPRVGAALQRLGAALRFEGMLPDAVRELVILVVAQHESSCYEWRAHLPPATRAGVEAESIDAVAAGVTPVPGLDPVAAAAVELAQVLLAGGAVDDPAYDRWRSALGEAGVFEVVAVTGYYRLLADGMRVFGIR